MLIWYDCGDAIVSVISLLALFGRLVLAGIFATAGVAKMAKPGSAADAALRFGVPATFAKWVATGLPLAELVTAALLLPAATALSGAVLSFMLLLIFLVAISHNLARGRTPPCNCFGQSNAKPIGWHSIIRNVLLMFVAGGIAWSSYVVDPIGVAALLGTVSASLVMREFMQLFLLLSMATVLFLLFQIIGQQGRILMRLAGFEEKLSGQATTSSEPVNTSPSAGLPIGAPAPRFNALTLDGQFVSCEQLTAAGKPVLLLFTNPGCGPCNALLPEVAVWQISYSDAVSIRVIGEGTPEENRGKKMANVILQSKREIAEAFGAWGTPAAVVVLPNGVIGSGLAQGADAIRRLVTEVVTHARVHRTNAAPRQTGLMIGERAPLMQLRGFDDKPTSADVYRRRKLVLLFWNPGCGFCTGMTEELLALASRSTPSSAALLIVSVANDEALQRLSDKFAVFADPDRNLAQSFGAHGTPMAIEIDAEGLIASALVAGKQEVLKLIARQWSETSLSHRDMGESLSSVGAIPL